MRRLASGGKWRWLPGSGLGGADAASRRCKLRPGRRGCSSNFSGQGGADVVAGYLRFLVDSKAHLPDARSHRRHRVLGEEKAGQVHGMGLLPVPKQVYGRRTHHFKDINIVSLDGSSSDVETHMLEKIRQLKEHSRMQDKVIEELKNNQRHHENQEATMRVHCVAPNQNDRFLEHKDELNKETCDSEYSDDDSLLLSTTSKTTKKQKVGSMVLLMTSKYPNKANVAYATLLSTDLEAIVGGVKTGSQFYKVRIDHAIAKDEPLVRLRLGCNNIGDAQAKGVSIAWPSMFVQMING
ncbi:unnamed protein product [Miscanthus lutarioriparius]|uniref:Transposase Tnp1/En/Spm-like domain-containing protein n=1 Tax=Miscanthus lutarioriparius TaxID=422564 RepID=A0A811QMJ1_9POAL|nr:unnamed protein product [Miscanthus lutarioriparius]